MIKSEGFSEAGISTRDLNGWVNFLTRVGGYEEVWRGVSSDGNKALWQTPVQETVLECLLRIPGHSSGFIRLFQFSNINQEEIRPGAHSWDTGGIFDINFRVQSLNSFVDTLDKRGWKGISHPVEWQFGDLLTREWLVCGPDSVVIALMERLAPPLEGKQDFQKFSHVFNSSQIVSDMKRARDFYRKLGFIKVAEHNGPLPGKGGEVLGLSPEAAPMTPVELLILQPHGILSGAVELVTIGGTVGQNLAGRARPYNLGLNLLRFPVSDLRAFAAQIETLGILPVQGHIISSRLEPFGETGFMAVQTPDGAWLEFYQALN